MLLKPFKPFFLILLVSLPVFAGCAKTDEIEYKDIYYSAIDQQIRFGDVDYTCEESNLTISENEKGDLIGFIINEENAETFKREENYLYGEAHFDFVFSDDKENGLSYDKEYLQVFEMKEVNFKEIILVEIGSSYLLYKNIELVG